MRLKYKVFERKGIYLFYQSYNFFISVKPKKVSSLRYWRIGNSTTITWNPLKFGGCTDDLQYVIQMYHNQKQIFFEETSKNYFYCEWKCTDATSFKVWTKINGRKSNYTHRFFHKEGVNFFL